jgi:hypothetical protein
MSTAQMVAKPSNSSKPCKCGCSDCQGDCCNLECLVRPNFFCGQLLTDRDLKAFVDWISGKSALQRFREGWGVVCGLEATCSHLENEHNRVYVGAGYAVDCCGRDIVVCDPIWYDFQCDILSDPCCQKKTTIQAAGISSNRTTPPNNAPVGSIPFEQLRAFDVCLVSDEQMTGGRRALVRGNCAPMDDCQFTRIRETGKLVAKEVADPLAPAGSHDLELYRKQLTEFAEGIRTNSSSPTALLAYLAGSLHSFCFVEDWLCDLSRRKPNVPKDWLDGVFPYIIQDFRNHYLLCSCIACVGNTCDGDGVPICRVWIWDRKDPSCKMCKVVYIESRPPYRRFLSRECRPTEPGCVDVSRYIWRSKDEVLEELLGAGYDVRPHETGADEISILQKNEILCLRRGEKIRVHYFADPYGQDRVVAFEGQQTP